MGKGIAVEFKKRFGQVSRLKAQSKRVGECAVLSRRAREANRPVDMSPSAETPDSHRFVYYLITKEKYYGKPTYATLKSALGEMKQHMDKYQVRHLCLPRLGCGLDQLEWSHVRSVMNDVFSQCAPTTGLVSAGGTQTQAVSSTPSQSRSDSSSSNAQHPAVESNYHFTVFSLP